MEMSGRTVQALGLSALLSSAPWPLTCFVSWFSAGVLAWEGSPFSCHSTVTNCAVPEGNNVISPPPAPTLGPGLLRNATSSGCPPLSAARGRARSLAPPSSAVRPGEEPSG